MAASILDGETVRDSRSVGAAGTTHDASQVVQGEFVFHALAHAHDDG